MLRKNWGGIQGKLKSFFPGRQEKLCIRLRVKYMYLEFTKLV